MQSHSAEGIGCRGAITVDLRWDLDAKRIEGALASRAPVEIAPGLPGSIGRIELEGARAAPSQHGQHYRAIALPGDEQRVAFSATLH